MNRTDGPIRLTLLGDTHELAGCYFANIMGVHPRTSVGVYLDHTGAVITHTIRAGRTHDALVAKLHTELTRRGITFPDQHNPNTTTQKDNQ